MKSGHGSLRTKRTWPGSTTWTSRTLSLSSLAAAPRYRSKENLTSSAVTGSPLWNFVPLRRTNSYVRPSLETVHDSARLGVLSPPGIGFTSASWTAYNTMKGLMNASVSPGSSAFAARVTWSPQVLVSSGAAVAGLARPSSRGITRTAVAHRMSSARIEAVGGARVVDLGRVWDAWRLAYGGGPNPQQE